MEGFVDRGVVGGGDGGSDGVLPTWTMRDFGGGARTDVGSR